ncbi:hypothetical protein H9P43_010065 [Blastocladiella emersonii ATCC 22665]|nr:hypothetical protein H9P43_010065 [Blastocladiella emersonii ATCC 22665]
MCGRIALNVNPLVVNQRTGLRDWVGQERYRASTNVAPTRYQPVVVARQQLALLPSDPAPGLAEHQHQHHHQDAPVSPAARQSPAKLAAPAPPGTDPDVDPSACPPLFAPAEQDAYLLYSMKWGLVTTSALKRGGPQPINARDDSLRDRDPKAMFAPLRHRHRCVVIAQGFFEWVREGKSRHAYYVHRTDRQFLAMAGLFTSAQAHPGAPWIHSFTVVTCENAPSLSFLHDRMPVLLDAAGIRTWLDPSRNAWDKDLEALLVSQDNGLECFEVDPRVGKAGVEDPAFLVPYAKPAPTVPPLLRMFAAASSKAQSAHASTSTLKRHGGGDADEPRRDLPKRARRSPPPSPPRPAPPSPARELARGAPLGPAAVDDASESDSDSVYVVVEYEDADAGGLTGA